MKKIKKFNLELDAQTHTEIKQYTIINKITMKQFLRELVTGAFKNYKGGF